MPGSITPLPVLLDEEDQKIYDRLQPPKTIVVRYGEQKMVAELPYDGDAKPGCGSKLVIRTQRGIELATMLTTTCPNSGCSKSVSRKEMLQYVENSGGRDYPFTTNGRILRVATVDDLNEQARLDARKPDLIRAAKQGIIDLHLPMKLVDVELLLGGERIIFYYRAEQWVDFRELVRVLAGDCQTRIEMHQVTDREEARLTADYERCGQYCCCKNFLKVLKPVSMRSAKVQKATLDPTKISGRCGRLMCCLRYEDETYEELRKKLPHRKTIVETEEGVGEVQDTQILTQLVLVWIPGKGNSAYPLENIRILDKEETKAWRQQQKEIEDEQRERAAKYAAKRGIAPPTAGGGGNAAAPAEGRRDRGPRREGRGDRPPQGEPRRPRPGQPLQDGEVESREGGNSSQLPKQLPGESAGEVVDDLHEADASPTGEAGEGGDGVSQGYGNAAGDGGAPGDGGEKKRRRRRRRRGRGRGGAPGSGGGEDGGAPAGGDGGPVGPAA